MVAKLCYWPLFGASSYLIQNFGGINIFDARGLREFGGGNLSGLRGFRLNLSRDQRGVAHENIVNWCDWFFRQGRMALP